MTFEYRDPDYDLLRVEPAPHHSDGPRIILHAEFAHDLGTDMAEVAVPLDRVEEVVAGIRDAARTASGQQPEAAVAYGDGKGRVYCQRCAHTVETADVPLSVDHVDHWELCPSCGRHVADVAREAPATAQSDPTTADDPIQLRWGLNDVLWGDDDTVTVCLSGPNRESYWLKLDTERAAALRDDLAAPMSCTCDSAGPAFVPAGHYQDCPQYDEPAPAVGQPAEAQAADEALTASERQFLTFALELAADQMANRGDEFDDEDEAALARLRRMAEEARS